MALPQAPEYPEKIDAAVLKIAGVVVLGAIMSILDITVVNVALPTFQTVVRQRGRPDRLLPRGVDRHRLHARPRDGHPDDRLGRRPVRHQAPLPPRHRPVHCRLGAVRHRDDDQHAHPVPRSAGSGRRHADAARHDDHDPSGRAPADGPPDGHPRCADAARPHPRADPRWLADRPRQLALDLPDQRPDRRHRRRLRLSRSAQ